MKEILPVKLKTLRRAMLFCFEKPRPKHYTGIWCKLYYVHPNKLYKVVALERNDTKYIDGDTLVYRY